MAIDLSQILSLPDEVKLDLAGRLVRDLTKGDNQSTVRLPSESGDLVVCMKPTDLKALAKYRMENCTPEYREVLRHRIATIEDDKLLDIEDILKLVDEDAGELQSNHSS